MNWEGEIRRAPVYLKENAVTRRIGGGNNTYYGQWIKFIDTSFLKHAPG